LCPILCPSSGYDAEKLRSHSAHRGPMVNECYRLTSAIPSGPASVWWTNRPAVTACVDSCRSVPAEPPGARHGRRQRNRALLGLRDFGVSMPFTVHWRRVPLASSRFLSSRGTSFVVVRWPRS